MLQVGSKIGAAMWHQFRGRRKRAPRTVIGHLLRGTFWAIFRHSKLTLANEMLCSPPGAREEQVHRTVLVSVAAWPCLCLALWVFKSPLARSAKCKNAVLRSESILGNSEHSFGLRLIADQPFIFSEKEIGPIISSIRRAAAENESHFCFALFLQFVLGSIHFFLLVLLPLLSSPVVSL